MQSNGIAVSCTAAALAFAINGCGYGINECLRDVEGVQAKLGDWQTFRESDMSVSNLCPVVEELRAFYDLTVAQCGVDWPNDTLPTNFAEDESSCATFDECLTKSAEVKTQEDEWAKAKVNISGDIGTICQQVADLREKYDAAESLCTSVNFSSVDLHWKVPFDEMACSRYEECGQATEIAVANRRAFDIAIENSGAVCPAVKGVEDALANATEFCSQIDFSPPSLQGLGEGLAAANSSYNCDAFPGCEAKLTDLAVASQDYQSVASIHPENASALCPPYTELTSAFENAESVCVVFGVQPSLGIDTNVNSSLTSLCNGATCVQVSQRYGNSVNEWLFRRAQTQDATVLCPLIDDAETLYETATKVCNYGYSKLPNFDSRLTSDKNQLCTSANEAFMV